MFSWLPAPLLALISLSLYFVNTLFWVVPIFIGSLLKLCVPLAFWHKIFSYLLDLMAGSWVAVNSINQKLFTHTKLLVKGVDKLSMNDWYLVISNHQSWVDILVLQRVFHGKIPFLKFFLKKELIWVPFLGVAWWALDFPFMRRYSQKFLAKNPHLKGKDIETTRRACEKFKHKPVSIMNFLEGTRYTQAKHTKQNSPFSKLLKPKAGGAAFVLGAMGQHLTKIVNVTIYYPGGIPTFMDFASSKVNQVKVSVKTMDITPEMIGDYSNDEDYRESFQQWLNDIWREKDQQLVELSQK